jgi:hypothetical protein
MGIGTLLYFKMIRHFALTFAAMFVIASPIIFSFSGTFQEVVNSATPFYLATTRALTAPEDCLRIKTEDSAAAFSALCQTALNQTVVSVLGGIVLTASEYSLMVAMLDACYTLVFIISLIRFFNLAKKYTTEQDYNNCTIQE